jgi:hypothetical protein
MFDIKSILRHHRITMRTTLDVENDVLDAARALATARGVSVGAALSELARRGVAARMPMSSRNGFPVFQAPAGTPGFGPDEVAAAEEMQDREAARQLLEPGR